MDNTTVIEVFLFTVKLLSNNTIGGQNFKTVSENKFIFRSISYFGVGVGGVGGKLTLLESWAGVIWGEFYLPKSDKLWNIT